MTKPQLAAQLYTVRGYTQTAQDFAESMKKIRAIGYQAVQISSIGPIPHDEVWRICNDNGLVICNTHISYGQLWNHIDDVIEQHRLWNCKHVAIGSMPEEFRSSEAGFKRFAQEASAIGEKLACAGLTFSYHNHSFEFVRFGSRTGLEILYAESDPRYLQAEIDTFWVQHGGGDPADWIRRMKNRMPVVHLKDMTVVNEGGEIKQIMAEVGEGNLNWPAVIAACREAGVEWYAVEQDICRRDPFESLKISYQNLQAMGLA
ncbi:MAG: sugar phosphate isomerase/epimerase [Chloroflexi bacterium]|nr:sugar phosphate isomerase/epimerase [Chloroflexota bacterium]